MPRFRKLIASSLAIAFVASYITVPGALAGQLSFDGVPVDITTSDGEDLVILPGTGGNTQIGAGTGNTNAGTNNDLYVSGVLEVDGAIYADGGIISAGSVVPAATSLNLGSSSVAWKNFYVDSIFADDIAKVKNIPYSWPQVQGVPGTVLTNDGVGNLTWAPPGTPLPVSDLQSIVKGSVDGTKLLRFEVDGLTTGTTRVMTVPDRDGTLVVADATGRVGVGAAAVAEKLEVTGKIKILGTGNGILFPDGTSLISGDVSTAAGVANATNAVMTADVDANATGDVILKTGVNDRLHILNNGNVGLGTASPAQLLHLSSQSANGTMAQIDSYDATAPTPAVIFRSARGTTAAPTATQADDVLGALGARGFADDDFSAASKVRMNMLASENWSNTNQGTYITFDTTTTGTTTRGERLRITDAGYVGIGTTTPQSPLDVTGDIRISSGSGGQLVFADGTTMNSASVGAAGAVSNISDAIITGDSDANASGGVILKTGSNDRLHVLNNGNVGIGSSNPGNTLDVAGGTNRIKVGTGTWGTAGFIIGADPNVSSAGIWDTVTAGQLDMNNARFWVNGLNTTVQVPSYSGSGQINFRFGTVPKMVLYDLVGKGAYITAGTAVADVNALNVAQTWNAAGTSFTALKMDVTNTASAADSKLVEYLVNSNPVFTVYRNNGVAFGNTSGNGGSRWGVFGDGSVTLTLGRPDGGGGISSPVMSWASNNSNAAIHGDLSLGRTYALRDVILSRDAANVLALRNGTSPQTFNLYNTYTDASNYERASLGYASNVLTLDSNALGTGTARNINITGGNVGIGSATPGYKLDVAGDVNVTGNFKVNGTNIATTQWASGSGLIYYNGGNVGIGTSNPATKLEVVGTITAPNINSPAGTRYLTLKGDPTDATFQGVIADVGNSGAFYVRGGSLLYSNTVAAEAGGALTLATVNNNANVIVAPHGTGSLQVNSKIGIGTVLPASILHIVGADPTATLASSTAFDGAPKSIVDFSGKYTAAGAYQNFAQVVGGKEDASDGGRAGYLQIKTRQGSNVLLDVVRVTSTGTVGINTTNPGYTLDVQGGQVNSSTGFCIAGNCITSWTGTGQWLSSGNNIYSSNSGNVGIGTTNPTSKLTMTGNIQMLTAGAEINAPSGSSVAVGAVNGNAYLGNSVRFGSTMVVGDARVGIASPTPLAWSNDANSYGTNDIGLSRGAAGKLYVGNGSQGNSTGTLVAGRIGIGTTAPGELLHLSSNTSTGTFAQIDSFDATAPTPAVIFRSARGTAAVPTATQLDDVLGAIGGRGYGDDAFSSASKARINFLAAENWTNAAQGTNITFDTTASGGTTRAEVMRVTQDARVGVGTTAPGYKLDVAGDVNVTGNFKINGTNINNAASVWTTSGNNIYNANSGNVGVGQSNPSLKLDVNGTMGNSAGAVAINAGGTNQAITLSPSGTGQVKVNVNAAADEGFVVDFNESQSGGRKYFFMKGGTGASPQVMSIGGLDKIGYGGRIVFNQANVSSQMGFHNGYDQGMMSLNTTTVGLPATIKMGGSVQGYSGYTDQFIQLTAPSAGVFAQQNGTNPQTFQVYNTYTDASNYERFGVTWAGNAVTVGAQAAGTGTLRSMTLVGNSNISFSTQGAVRWTINDTVGGNSGALAPAGDNGYTLGYPSQRVNRIYLGPGTAALPAVSIGSAANGLYYAATNQLGISTNGAEVVRVDATGNVGIGSITPSTKLDVNGTVNATAFTVAGGAITSSQWTSGSGLIYYNGGNVGIGTSNPLGILHVAKSTNGFTNTIFSNPSNGNAAINRVELGNDASDGIGQMLVYGSQHATKANYFEILNAANSPLGLGANNAVAMTILGSGNVGIGTTGPDTHLNVLGDNQQLKIAASTATAGAYLSARNGTAISYFGVESSAAGGVFTGSTAYSTVLGAGSAHALQFLAGGTVKATIDSTGNVGIGTTNPTYKLDIGNLAASSNVDNSIRMSSRGDATGPGDNYLSSFVMSNSTDYGASNFKIETRVQNNTNGIGARFYVNSSAASGVPLMAMSLFNNGNVGIGSTTPGYKLDVAGDVNVTGNFKVNGTNISQNTQWTTSGNNIYNANSGNVGIGTSAPGAKLDVRGPILLGDTNGYFRGAPSQGFRFNNNVDSLNLVHIYDTGGVAIGTTYAISTDPGVNNLIVQGNVGIGTAVPGNLLHLSSNASAGTFAQIDSFDATAPTPALIMRSARGTAASPTATQLDDVLGALGGRGYGATGFSATSKARINLLASENWTDAAQGTYMTFDTTVSGTVTRSEAMRITSAGNVGIGTAIPAQKLSVAGTIESTSGGIKFPDGTTQTTAGTAPGASGWTDAGAVVSLATTGDNVGVGTSSPQASFKMDVRGLFRSSDSSNRGIELQPGALNSLVSYDRTGAAYLPLQVDATSIYLQASGAAKGLLVDTAGNVGIGTSAPTSKLSVSTSGATIGVTVQSIAGATGGAIGLGSLNSAGRIQAFANDAVSTSAVANLLLNDSGGNVGIGTTTPSSTLTVYNANESATQTDLTQALTKSGINIVTDFTDGAYTPGVFWSTQDNNATKPKAGIYMRETNSGSSLYLGTSSSYATGITSDTLVIGSGRVGVGAPAGTYPFEVTGEMRSTTGAYLATASGNVGIGTTTPGVKLQLNSTNANSMTAGTAAGGLAVLGSTGLFGLYAGVTNSGTSWIQSARNDAVTYYDLALQANGGNVGIGSASPGTKLDVAGTVNATAFTVAGSPLTASQWTSGSGLIYYSGGNIGIGTTSPAGTLEVKAANDVTALTVTGGSVTGSGTTPLINAAGTWNTSGAPTAVKVNITNTASGGAPLLMDLQVGGASQFSVGKTGAITTGTGTSTFNGQTFFNSTMHGDNIRANSAGFAIQASIAAGSSGNALLVNNGGAGNFSAISGDTTMLRLAPGSAAGVFAPTSGTGTFEMLSVDPTINQTGGANGVTRGVYINPTLTAAADFRALETTVGNVVLGSTSGNVGIGTTSPASKLEVFSGSDTSQVLWGANIRNEGNANLTGYGAGLKLKISGEGGPNELYKWAGIAAVAGTAYSNRTDLALYSAATSTANATEKVRITGDGNVGIGSLAPGQKLTVAGTIESTSGGFKFPDGTTMTSAGTGSASSLSNATDVIVTADSDANASGTVLFKTGSTDRMTILNNGNVGIGTTAPVGRLTIGPAPNATHSTGEGLEVTTVNQGLHYAQAVLFSGDALAANKGGKLAFGGTYTGAGADTTWAYIAGLKDTATDGEYGGYMTFSTRANGANEAERMRITSAGNVGIGTSTPGVIAGYNRYFTISANTDGQVAALELQSKQTSDADLSGIEFLNDANRASAIIARRAGANNSGELNFYTNNAGTFTKKMVIDKAGNVGIGSATPGYKLDVAGDVNVTGNFKINGTNIAQGGQWTTSGNNIYNANSGNVGIGTSAPGAKLDVRGPILLGDTNGYFRGAPSQGFRFNNNVDSLNLVHIYDTGGVAIGTTYAISTDPGVNNLIVQGNVGIGTTAPGNLLHLSSNASTGTFAQIDSFDATAPTPALIMRSARGTAASPTATQADDVIGAIGGRGYGDNAFSSASKARINFLAAENWTNAAQGTYMTFDTTAAAGTTRAEQMRITSAGNVGIGTAIPAQKLSVAGTIESTSGGIKFPDGTTQTTAGTAPGSSGWTDAGTVVQLATAGDNVGVGTTSPQASFKMDVRGLFRSSDSSNRGIELQPGALNSLVSYDRTGAAYLPLQVDATSIYLQASGAAKGLLVDTAGNVGIGTSAPTSKLSVSTSGATIGVTVQSIAGATGGAIGLGSLNSAGRIQAFANDAVSTSAVANLLLNDSGGNVGIGTTTPSSTLTVYNANESATQTDLTQALTKSGINIVTDFTDGAYTPGVFWSTQDNNATKPKAGIYMRETNSGSSLYLGTSNSYATGITSDTLVIGNGRVGVGALAGTYPFEVIGEMRSTTGAYLATASGNVGIGTTTPGVKLQLNSTNANSMTAGTAAGGLAVLGSTGLFGLYAGVTNSGTSWIQSARNDAVTYYDLALQANGGNVGIGSAAPGYKLDVAGDINVTGNFKVNGTNLSTGQWTTSGNNIYNANSGNVGIGTTNPGYTFEVVKAGAGMLLDNTTNSGATESFLQGRTAAGAVKYVNLKFVAADATNGAFYIAPNNATAMTILSGGNVGIGTTNPTQGKLTIVQLAASPAAAFTSNTGQTQPLGMLSVVNDNASIGTAINVKEVDPSGTGINIINSGSSSRSLYANPSLTSDGSTVANMYGVTSALYLQGNGSSGTLTNFHGFTSEISSILLGGTLTNRYGYRAMGGHASITNNYGFYADDLLGTNQYAFYAAGADDKSYFAGNVGIGTVAPSSPLDVYGPSTISTDSRTVIKAFDTTTAALGTGGGILFGGKYQAAGGYSSFANIKGIKENATDNNYAGALVFSTTANGSDNTEKMRISSAGNVGIGSAAPGQKLSVAGTIESTSGGIKFPDGTTQVTAGTAPGASGWTDGGASVYNTTLTDNVGIGTTNPSSRLHVVGTSNEIAAIIGSSSPYITVGTAANTGGFFRWNTASSVIEIGPHTSGQATVLGVNSSNVGIGTTGPTARLTVLDSGALITNSGGALHVQGAFTTAEATTTGGPIVAVNTQNMDKAVMQEWFSSGAMANSQLNLYGTGNDAAFQARIYATGAVSDLLINPSGGNVGIGTTDPAATLHVAGGAIISTQATTTTNTDMNVLFVQSDGTVSKDSLLLWNPAQDMLTVGNGGVVINGAQVRSGGSNSLTLSNADGSAAVLINPTGGNVGVGTTSPNSKLQVSGSMSLPIVSKTAAYTATAADYTILCDATTAGFTISLPTAVGIAGRLYVIKKIDTSGSNVVVDPSTTETVDGAATTVLNFKYESVTVQSDGANWVIL